LTSIILRDYAPGMEKAEDWRLKVRPTAFWQSSRRSVRRPLNTHYSYLNTGCIFTAKTHTCHS